MGRGLQLEPTGNYVAFCAGTGALVFLDLVAHLIVKNSMPAAQVPAEIARYYAPGFKFHLYCSFQSRDQAIGLDLIEALVDLNKALGLDNFEATVRLSVTDGPKLPRWTPQYVESELSGKTLSKVWVCGPPAVNEMFDKTLGDLKDKLGLKAHQIDVM